MNSWFPTLCATLLVASTVSLSSWAAPPQAARKAELPIVYLIPDDAPDPNIRNGDSQNIVVLNQGAPGGRLLLFIGGAKQWETCYQKPFLEQALKDGYRAIALDYKYAPPGTQICPRSSDEFCYKKFRETKTFGIQSMPELGVLPAESIVARTSSLLLYLKRQHPQEGWEQFLSGSSPRWDNIAVSGHSQASGMAAFLARRERVARVILFSSPWDHFARPALLASWLSEPSATPLQRWYGAYHSKETETSWLARAYQALGIPASHIRVFTLEPSAGEAHGDHYHFSVLGGRFSPRLANGEYAYAKDWEFMLGSGTP